VPASASAARRTNQRSQQRSSSSDSDSWTDSLDYGSIDEGSRSDSPSASGTGSGTSDGHSSDFSVSGESAYSGGWAGVPRSPSVLNRQRALGLRVGPLTPGLLASDRDTEIASNAPRMGRVTRARSNQIPKVRSQLPGAFQGSAAPPRSRTRGGSSGSGDGDDSSYEDEADALGDLPVVSQERRRQWLAADRASDTVTDDGSDDLSSVATSSITGSASWRGGRTMRPSTLSTLSNSVGPRAGMAAAQSRDLGAGVRPAAFRGNVARRGIPRASTQSSDLSSVWSQAQSLPSAAPIGSGSLSLRIGPPAPRPGTGPGGPGFPRDVVSRRVLQSRVHHASGAGSHLDYEDDDATAASASGSDAGGVSSAGSADDGDETRGGSDSESRAGRWQQSPRPAAAKPPSRSWF
jgi:hypothetical protein